MAGISTSINITDRVSGALNRITEELYRATAAFGAVDAASEATFNTTVVGSIAEELYSYEQRVQELESELSDANNRLAEMEAQTTRAAQSANMLKSAFAMIRSVVGVIGIQKVFEASDSLVQTESRLNMMNQAFNEINGTAYETSSLINMVYRSAQDARGSFSQMSDVVARFGNNARDAFSSATEVVDFAELVQKQMTIAGASTSEASAAMLQLSQGLGSGVLRGDELNSIFEQAPNLIQNIASYIEENEAIATHMADVVGVSYEEMSTNAMGHIRDLASEGQISADIVKNAIFASADEINAKFAEMPMTWGQIWQKFQNSALMAFRPVLQRINQIANSDGFQDFVNSAINSMATLANVVLNIFDLVGMVGSFVADNWSVIKPIVVGVTIALGLYTAALVANNIAQGIHNVQKAIATVREYSHAKAILANSGAYSKETVATASATVAQASFNTTLLACPITWIIIAIIALIAILYAVCEAVAQLTGVANSGFGVICGGVNVVIQFFKNLGLMVANIALGIGSAIGALATNIMTAFHNAICSVQAWWYDLLSTALTVVAGICEALNKLPFVEFDYSGITAKADEYAAKSAEAAGHKEDYTSVGDAFDKGMSTFNTFEDGWVSDAFDAGASWGDGAANDVSSFVDGLFGNDATSALTDGITAGLDGAYKQNDMTSLAGSAAETAGNTADIADSIDVSNENLEYLRDIAERDTINRFTTAEIKVEMTNNNNVSSDTDLDGMITKLNDGVKEAMESAAEGVHK